MDERDTRPVAVVTGGGGDIGRCVGQVLLRDGMRVVLADVNVAPAEAAATSAGLARAGAAGVGSRPGPTIRGEHVDVADADSIRALVQRVASRYGRIDVLVNSAGVMSGGPLADFRQTDWDHTLAVNLRGPAELAQAILPYWQRQGTGAVVNVASRAWMAGGNPAYASSKAGLVGLTRSMAVQLALHGVHVNAVAPSFLNTSLTASALSGDAMQKAVAAFTAITPLGKLPEPIDVAEAVAFLASRRAAMITGEVIHVCGGSQLPPRP